jgi:DNA-binding transcriptional MerR regulator
VDRFFTVQELARAADVTVASIKFYVREGLLPPGDTSRPRRAYYDDRHVRRLAVIRALRDVARLPIDVIRRAVGALDASGADSVDAIAPAIDALEGPPERSPDEALQAARREVADLFTRERLDVRAEAGSRETLARTLVAVRRIDDHIGIEDVRRWLRAMREAAREEIENDRTKALLRSDKEGALEIAIMGTVVYEPILLALRRALHEHYSVRIVRKDRRRR